MADNMIDEAFEIFMEVHGRLGHEFQDRSDYFNRPCVKQMWVKVACLVTDIATRTWCMDSIKDLSSAADADAYEMYYIVHRRLGDGRHKTTREEFNSLAQLRQVWIEIANEVRTRARARRATWEV